MQGLQITEMVLLMIVGWGLMNLVVRDLLLTAYVSFLPQQSNFSRYLSSIWLVRFLVRITQSFEWRAVLLKRLNYLVPILQFIIWKGLTMLSFGCLYLAINLQTRNENFGNNFTEDFLASLWLSFSISFRIVTNDFGVDNPIILLLADIQFYLGCILVGLAVIYFLRLRQKVERLRPRLYNLQNKIKGDYTPFALSKLLNTYSFNNLHVILSDWEKWTKELRTNLKNHPHFIYSGIKNEHGADWLTALSVVLDASAALMVTANGAIESQARRTFRAARRTLIETVEFIGSDKNLKPSNKESAHSTNILEAEFVYENGTKKSDLEGEQLKVWRYTYRNYVHLLAVETEVKSKPAKSETVFG